MNSLKQTPKVLWFLPNIASLAAIRGVIGFRAVWCQVLVWFPNTFAALTLQNCQSALISEFYFIPSHQLLFSCRPNGCSMTFKLFLFSFCFFVKKICIIHGRSMRFYIASFKSFHSAVAWCWDDSAHVAVVWKWSLTQTWGEHVSSDRKLLGFVGLIELDTLCWHLARTIDYSITPVRPW